MVRITDVARAANVSPATVSRVLNQPDIVVPEKRERVLEAIRALNYSPNSLAHGLRAGAVKTVALLVGDISQPFHGAFAKAIDRVGERLGYRVILRDLDHNEDRLVSALDDLKPSDTYGVVLATADDLSAPRTRAAIAAAQERGLVVVSSSQLVDEAVPAIVPRYQAISHLATVHLETAGLWPIIFIGGGTQSPLSRERQEGFERASAELGHDDASEWVLDGHFAVDASREALGTVLNRELGGRIQPERQRFGVIAINLRMAIGALQAITDRGLEVPRHAGLVCCEDLPMAAEWRPAITTVGVEFDALAEATFASLVAGRDASPVTFLPHRLSIRSSSQLL
jgi:DNA-binding LacI/PurR family transcriptional regulator